MTNPTDKIHQARYLCLAADCAEKSNNAKVQDSKNFYKMASIIYQNVAKQVGDKNPEISYSKIHQRFSERLKQPDALTNPEKYLGPNYKDVLNFWIYVDGLSDQDKKEMWQLCFALDYTVQESALIAAMDAADEVVGKDFRIAALESAKNVTGWRCFGVATLELIGGVKNKVSYELIMSHKKS
jgi:hypothetical protein